MMMHILSHGQPEGIMSPAANDINTTYYYQAYVEQGRPSYTKADTEYGDKSRETRAKT